MDQCTLAKAIGERIVIRYSGGTLTDILAGLHVRGGRVWLETSNGHAILLEADTVVELGPVVGTLDFLETPEARFPHIYAAYDEHGEAPIRFQRMCNCVRCQTTPVEPTGLGPDGTPLDDKWIVPSEGGAWWETT